MQHNGTQNNDTCITIKSTLSITIAGTLINDITPSIVYGGCLNEAHYAEVLVCRMSPSSMSWRQHLLHLVDKFCYGKTH